MALRLVIFAKNDSKKHDDKIVINSNNKNDNDSRNNDSGQKNENAEDNGDDNHNRDHNSVWMNVTKNNSNNNNVGGNNNGDNDNDNINNNKYYHSLHCLRALQRNSSPSAIANLHVTHKTFVFTHPSIGKSKSDHTW